MANIWVFLCLLPFGKALDLPSVQYDRFHIVQAKLDLSHTEDLNNFITELSGTHRIRFLEGCPQPNKASNILVAPESVNVLKDFLTQSGATFTVLTENLQRDIVKEAEENEAARAHAQLPDGTYDILHYFARYDEVLEWMQQKAAGSSIATLQYVGHTFENRNTPVMKISSGGSGKKIFWLDCGIHAREWITVPVCNYAIDQLLSGYESDSNITRMLDLNDFYILPMTNPDGYEYTFTDDRMWRKTRVPTNFTDPLTGERCHGADPNRNFGYQWNAPGGASDNGCADDFRGPSAFSDNCTANVRDFMTGLGAGRVGVYMSLHSYSQLWMVPWGYTDDSRPGDYVEMDRLGIAARDALEWRHGMEYDFGTVPDLLYIATGSSMDWAKGSLGVRYTYTLELRPDSFCGCNGFIVAPAEIKPTSEEVWEGIMVTALEQRWN